MDIRSSTTRRPTSQQCVVGLLLTVVMCVGCSRLTGGLSSVEVIDRIAKNECVSAQLAGAPLLVGLWSAGEPATYIRYPDSASTDLTPRSKVQLGSLTASFVAPRMLAELEDQGLTLDSIAIAVRGADGQLLRNITFGQLLLHSADVPVYEPGPDGSALDHLLAMNELLARQDPGAIRGGFRFDHWNYRLAAEAISSRAGGLLDLRAPALAYNDRLPDSIRNNLAATRSRLVAPQENQRPELFALSTAGVGDARQLVDLLDSLAGVDLARMPTSEPIADRQNTTAIPGWYRVALKDGRPIYVNSGLTRRHGAAVAYFPDTQTGVVAVAADSKRLDCLVVDILRNLNDDWKRTGYGQEE